VVEARKEVRPATVTNACGLKRLRLPRLLLDTPDLANLREELEVVVYALEEIAHALGLADL